MGPSACNATYIGLCYCVGHVLDRTAIMAGVAVDEGGAWRGSVKVRGCLYKVNCLLGICLNCVT